MFDFRKREPEQQAAQENEEYGENSVGGALREDSEQYGGYGENAYESSSNDGYDAQPQREEYVGEEQSAQYDDSAAEYSQEAAYTNEYAAEQYDSAATQYADPGYEDQAEQPSGEQSYIEENTQAFEASEPQIAQHEKKRAYEDDVEAEEVQLSFDPNDYVVNMMYENVPIFEADYTLLSKDEKDKFIECILESFRTSVLNVSSLVGLVLRKNKRLTQCDEVMKAYEYQKLDFENYKRRTAGAEEKAKDEAIMKTVKSILPTLDNFDRALPMIADEKIKEGMVLIQRQLIKALAGLGVTEMQAIGQEFDPDYHNAVLTRDAESQDEVDRVVEVLQKGYMLGSKVVRYAQVRVAK